MNIAILEGWDLEHNLVLKWLYEVEGVSYMLHQIIVQLVRMVPGQLHKRS